VPQLGGSLSLHVVRRERFRPQIVLEREQPACEAVIDFQPIVTQQIALIVAIRLRLRARPGNRLGVERCQVTRLEHRRRRPVAQLAAQRELRVEPVVALMRGQGRAGKALVAADRREVERTQPTARAYGIVAAAAGEARRRVRR
jgi:hypothetical protein